MTKRYTDDDVQHLVWILKTQLRSWSGPQYGSIGSDAIKQALKPFLPDPEDALIEKMAEAYVQVLNGHCNPKDPLRVEAMKAALGVVKRKGLPT